MVRSLTYEEWQEKVLSILDEAERTLLGVARKHGMPEDGVERLRGPSDRPNPHIQKLVGITGILQLSVLIVVHI